jgi:hypothetical protein
MNTTRSAGFEPVHAVATLLSGLAVPWWISSSPTASRRVPGPPGGGWPLDLLPVPSRRSPVLAAAPATTWYCAAMTSRCPLR